MTPVGDWIGILKLPSEPYELHLALHVTVDEVCQFHGTIDNLDQGSLGLPRNAIFLVENEFSFSVPQIDGRYDGLLTDMGSSMMGTWTQSSVRYRLQWTRGLPDELDRPQTPKPLFPYHIKDVIVHNSAAKLYLAGTFTFPARVERSPAVFLITGSGPHDRDETVFGHKPFMVVADFLTRKGFAVLRVDDRGIEESSGRYHDATTADFATDALAAVEFLRDAPEVDPAHIGLIGHSEGAMIAPMVAIQSALVSFIVLLAGHGVPGEVLYPEQVYRCTLARGSNSNDARAASVYAANWMSVLRRADTADKAVEMVHIRHDVSQAAELQAQMRSFCSVWFRCFATYDPYPTLQKVTCPVLALNGSTDLQVPAELNVPFLRLAVAWNPRSSVEIVHGVNHMFQSTRSGSPIEYARITETFSPRVLKELATGYFFKFIEVEIPLNDQM